MISHLSGQNHRRYLNPRNLTGGRSAYVFRRETCLEPDRTFSLGITTRLKEKEGIIFGGAKDFWNLGEDSRATHNSVGMDRITFEEMKEKIDEDKKKTKKKKKIPSVNQIRNHLKNIISYHEDSVKKSMHCAYPLMDEVLEAQSKEVTGTDVKGDSKETYNRPFSYAPAKGSSNHPPPPGMGGARTKAKAPPRKRAKK